MEFYKSAFGGTMTMMTYKEGGMPHKPVEDGKIMHAMLQAFTLTESQTTPSGIIVALYKRDGSVKIGSLG